MRIDTHATAAARPNTSTLKLATYNVLFQTRPDQTKADLKKLMAQNGVIHLQEFDAKHHALLPWIRQQGWGVVLPKGSAEPVLFDKSRYDLLDSGDKKLNDPVQLPGRGHYPARHAVWARLKDKKTGADFTSISVHTIAHDLGPKKTPRFDAIKRQQFKELTQLADRFDAKGPVLIGGDLNAQPGRKIWPAKQLKQAGLVSNWTELGMKGVIGTHGKNHIDNVLTEKDQRKNLKLESQHVVKGLHSDHRALEVRYRLENPSR